MIKEITLWDKVDRKISDIELPEYTPLLLTILVLAFILITSYVSPPTESPTEKYIRECREARGVPIYNNRSMNCAKEGYIDIIR